MVENKEILMPVGITHGKTYRIEVRQRSIFGSLAHENFVQATIEKNFVKNNEAGSIYKINILDRKQNNTVGPRAMEQDLAFLQKRLMVQTDFYGNITKVINRNEIKHIWEDFRGVFYRKYGQEKEIQQTMSAIDSLLADDNLFTASINQSDMATLLFPPIYGKPAEETSEQQKDFTDFFGASTLPLKITTTVKKQDKIHVLRKGILDTARFEDEEVTQYFRDIADNYKLAVQVSVDYIETYDLDKNYWITHAGQLFRSMVKGLFHYEQIARVTPIK